MSNVLSLRMFKSMKKNTRYERRAYLLLQPKKTVLGAYGGMGLRLEGILTFTCSTTKAQASLPFYISRHSSIPILGREACEELHLVKRVDIDTLDMKHPTTKEELIVQHSTVFEGLGGFPESITSTQTPSVYQSYMAAEKYHWQYWRDSKPLLMTYCMLS